MKPLGPQSRVERVVLERLKLQVRKHLPREVAARITLTTVEGRTFSDYLADTLLVELASEVLGERVDEQTVVSSAAVEFASPSSWWQHWKADHAGAWYARWLVRRWPVRNRAAVRTARVSVNVERLRTYPNITFNYRSDDVLGKPVVVLRAEPAVWRWEP